MGALSKIYVELGVKSLVESPRDAKILCLLRLTRMFAYGSSTLVLTLFLSGLGNDPERLGFFMTLTLWGDVLISLFLTLIADRVGRRTILAGGALLLSVSGIIFATCSNFWVLLAASVLGIISPSGSEVGPFKAIEESTLVQLVETLYRSNMLAWYNLSGTAGVATGVIIFGWVIENLQNHHQWNVVASYRIVYWAYAALGLVMCTLSLSLTPICEVSKLDSSMEASETAPLLPDADTRINDNTKIDTKRRDFLFPSLSAPTVRLLLKLCFVFAFDSLGAGMASGSWLVYFFSTKFGLQTGSLGTLFFTTSILSSAANLLSGSLSRRIGLLMTMVSTHFPASLCLLLLPIPSNKDVAILLLILRSTVTSMSQAPRQAFIAGAVEQQERTTVMGIINVSKTLTHSFGPMISGILAQAGKFEIALVIAGALKCSYDVLLLAFFAGYQTREDQLHADVSSSDAVMQDGEQIHRRTADPR